MIRGMKTPCALVAATLFLSGSALSAQPYSTRFIYFMPSDKSVQADFLAGIERAATTLAGWYPGQLGGRTILLNSPIVEQCHGAQAESYYTTSSYSRVLAAVQGCIPEAKYNDPLYRYVIYADVRHACNAPERLGAGGSGVTIMPIQDLEGLAARSSIIDDCGEVDGFTGPLGVHRWIGGLGHELGHALGLPHPPGCDQGLSGCDSNALMWVGYASYPNTYLRSDDRATVLSTPFVPITLPNPPRLANISTRMRVQTGNDVMIAGFIVGGATSKTVAVNVAGPSLANFGVTGTLFNPKLTLVRSSDQSVVATNDNWGSGAGADVTAVSISGFQPNSSNEPALVATLPPGAYTAIVEGVSGSTGVALVGVFEMDHPETPLVNISTRGQVLTGNDVMIAGLIVQGSAPRKVVINVAGPSLAGFGIANFLANPTLTLIRSSDNTVIASNDDWQSQANPADAAAISATGFQPNHSLEPALIATLAPGAYTAIVQGSAGGTGVGLVGVFVVP